MCGIFGYVGQQQAGPILLEGLKTLEYRGYDSAGIYLPATGVTKVVGPIANLIKKFNTNSLGTSGIAHTRWATHGAPTEENAHPHHDMSELIWIAHNGVIENYRELKEGLLVRGVHFYSDTDTEVLAKLIGTFYNGDLAQAVIGALQSVRGTYGLVVMHENHPDLIVAASLGSPIVLGVGKEGNFVASDPSALLVHTKDVVYLNDGDIATIKKDKYQVKNIFGQIQNRPSSKITWAREAVQKGGFAHFMQKEIFDSAEVIEDTIRGRILLDQGQVKLGGLESSLPKLRLINRLQIIGCGSSFYAAQVGKFMFETYARLPIDVELGSEYRYKTILADKQTAALLISQSGETADMRASLVKVKELGLLSLGIVNVVGSALSREVDAGVHNHAGPEVAVASTKAFLSQLTVLALITLFFARDRGLSQSEGQLIAKEILNLPNVVKNYLNSSSIRGLEKIAKKYSDYNNIMYIGRGSHGAIAREGALKLKEVSYIHAEGFAGGELKHGPLALLDKNFPVFTLVPQDNTYDRMLANVEEAKSRLSPVIVLTTEGEKACSNLTDDIIFVPKVHPLLQPIISTIPLHLFAYYVGVAKGLDVDHPRNLAKSVTVE